MRPNFRHARIYSFSVNQKFKYGLIECLMNTEPGTVATGSGSIAREHIVAIPGRYGPRFCICVAAPQSTCRTHATRSVDMNLARRFNAGEEIR
jgi:hypothetical protein